MCLEFETWRSKSNTTKYTEGQQHIVTITHINVTSFSVGFFEISPVKRKFCTKSLHNERLTAYEVFWAPYSEDKLRWSLYLAFFFFFKIFERASLLLPGPSKEPALSKMDYVSDRDLLQLTLGEVYGVFRIDQCLYGAESRSKFLGAATGSPYIVFISTSGM